METTTDTTEQTVTLSVPTMFWADHYHRASDDGQPVGTPVKEGPKKTTVVFDTADALHNFMQDAAYYTDTWKGGEWRRDDDPWLYSLGRSANTTKEFIRKNRPDLCEEFNASRWAGPYIRY